MKDKRQCATCIWYDEEGLCVNGDSPYCGEYVEGDEVCSSWNSDGEEWRQV